jgi:hypothetical protein
VPLRSKRRLHLDQEIVLKLVELLRLGLLEIVDRPGVEGVHHEGPVGLRLRRHEDRRDLLRREEPLHRLHAVEARELQVEGKEVRIARLERPRDILRAFDLRADAPAVEAGDRVAEELPDRRRILDHQDALFARAGEAHAAGPELGADDGARGEADDLASDREAEPWEEILDHVEALEDPPRDLEFALPGGRERELDVSGGGAQVGAQVELAHAPPRYLSTTSPEKRRRRGLRSSPRPYR